MRRREIESTTTSSPSMEGAIGESAKKEKKKGNIGARGKQAFWTLFLMQTAPLHGKRRGRSVTLGRNPEQRQEEGRRAPANGAGARRLRSKPSLSSVRLSLDNKKGKS